MMNMTDPEGVPNCAPYLDSHLPLTQSKLEIRPDGRLYLLSDQSATIARLDDLPPGGGMATVMAAWRLHELDGKPEGLAFTAEGRAIVALDKRKARHNLVLLEPPIAPSQSATQT
jgi:hypothetical protein